jgi:hypothetical protein
VKSFYIDDPECKIYNEAHPWYCIKCAKRHAHCQIPISDYIEDILTKIREEFNAPLLAE